MLIDVVKLWLHDDVVVRTALRALFPLASNDGDEAEHILQMGGRQLIEDVMLW